MELQGKIALITGASRGIGPYIAKSLAQKGMTIIAVARSEKGLQITQSEVESNGGICHVQPFDLTNINGVEDFINDVWLKHGSIHVLVNNAGVTQDNLLMRMKEDQWDTVLNINLKGAFHGMKAAVRPMMKNRHGRIINIASIVGITGNPGQANYAASKAGLDRKSVV